MKSTSFLHHFGYSLHHYYIKIGGFYIISTPAKNPPAKSLHRFYIIISDFYTIPTPKSEESTSFLYHSGIQCTHRCGHPIWYQRTGYFVQIQFSDILFDTLCESPKTISSLHRSYIIPISFFRFLYHFYIAENLHSCRHYIIPISFFRFLHRFHIKKDECYINPISLRLSGEFLTAKQ